MTGNWGGVNIALKQDNDSVLPALMSESKVLLVAFIQRYRDGKKAFSRSTATRGCVDFFSNKTTSGKGTATKITTS